jgi:osmotically-inducible protein OsmY
MNLHRFPIRFVVQASAVIAISLQLNACLPVVAGGAATTGVMASDRRSSGTFIDDEAIEFKVLKAISDNLGMQEIHANVTSYNRNVLITGEVSSEANKDKAETAIKAIDANIRKITNEMKVGPSSSLGARTNDAYITSKVKGMFIKKNLFPANYVKVVTEDSIVYLMGIVTKKEAEDAADIASHVSDVKQVVKVFDYID